MFNVRLKEQRKLKGYTLKKLGEKVGLAESTMSLYEAGKREPDLTTVNALADVLEVSTDYLLGRTDTPVPPKIPDILEGAKVAFSGGGNVEGLTQDDVDMLHELALIMAEKNKKKGVSDVTDD